MSSTNQVKQPSVMISHSIKLHEEPTVTQSQYNGTYPKIHKKWTKEDADNYLIKIQNLGYKIGTPAKFKWGGNCTITGYKDFSTKDASYFMEENNPDVLYVRRENGDLPTCLYNVTEVLLNQ